MLHTAALLLLLCILRTFPHSLYPGTFLMDQEHLHRQRCCVQTILTVQYVFIFSVYGALSFLSAFIVFILSLYRSSTGFKNTFKVCIQHKWNPELILSIVSVLLEQLLVVAVCLLFYTYVNILLCNWWITAFGSFKRPSFYKFYEKFISLFRSFNQVLNNFGADLYTGVTFIWF